MKLSRIFHSAAVLLFASAVTQAAAVTVTLEQSTQNFVEYGLGPDGFGNPNWDLQQGACGLSGGITTCTLSGVFIGSTAAFASGSYSFVTTYSGNLSSITGVGEAPPNQNYFNYSYLAPSTSMVLTLVPISGSADVETLVSGGQILNSDFSFLFTGTYSCSGAAVPSCSASEVGDTAGAIGQGPVVTTVTFDSATIPTPPTNPTVTPEPRFFASTGLALLLVTGLMSRRRQKA